MQSNAATICASIVRDSGKIIAARPPRIGVKLPIARQPE